MSPESSTMRLNSWVAFSLIFILAGITGVLAVCPKDKNAKVDFVVETRFSSEDDQAPFYFAEILKICSNSRFIYVADWKESKITILDKELRFVKRIGHRGQGPGEFSQIFVDIACDENRIFLLTINRVYVFTREGNYEHEVVLRFIPRQIYPVENGWLFKLNDSEETIYITDWKGVVRSRSIRVPMIRDSNCPQMYANPEVFLDTGGRIYLMETREYRIRRITAKTMTVEKEIKRNIDFEGMRCRKVNLGEYGPQYLYAGGFSWFLENEDQLLYFYWDSRGKLRIDSYRNDGTLHLNWNGIVEGNFRPLAVVQGDLFLGISGDDHGSVRYSV